MKLVLSFVVCVAAVVLALAASHGPAHLLINPGSVAIFLVGSALGLCCMALIVTGGLRLATGASFQQTWWPSLLLIAVLAALALYLIELVAR